MISGITFVAHPSGCAPGKLSRDMVKRESRPDGNIGATCNHRAAGSSPARGAKIEKPSTRAFLFWDRARKAEGRASEIPSGIERDERARFLLN